MATQQLQKAGEEAALRFLESRGMRLLARNWRIRSGELDLVMMEGSTLVFVEVKARVSDHFIDPALAVNYRKQQRLRRLASIYLAHFESFYESCRFDVVSVVASGRPFKICHLPNAFS